MTTVKKDLYEKVGKKLRKARKAAGMTQLELAEAAEISRAAVANIEVGRQNVNIHTLYVLSAHLSIDPRKLLPAPPPSVGVKLDQLNPFPLSVVHYIQKITKKEGASDA